MKPIIKQVAEEEKTPDEIIKEANIIWRKVGNRKLLIDDEDGRGDLLVEMQREHINFARAYPIVLRFMCSLSKFSTKAFKYYLCKIKNNPWKNETEYLDSQVDYLVLLYKETNRGWTPQMVNNYKDTMRKTLQTEHDDMKKIGKEQSEFVKKLQKEREENQTEILRMFYEKHKDFLSTVDKIPIKVESDLLDMKCMNDEFLNILRPASQLTPELLEDASKEIANALNADNLLS